MCEFVKGNIDLKEILNNFFFEIIKLSVGRVYLWKLYGFKSCIISWVKRGKVDYNIGIWMFVYGFGYVFVNCKKELLECLIIVKWYKGGFRFCIKWL